ncbi:MAG: IS21 family transposase [Planctomycetota bacterium]|jgi:transposase
MEDYDRVRALHFKDGLSQREISRRTGFHRDTIKKMIGLAAPPGYRRQEEPRRPVLGPFIPIIDAILKADKTEPRKQRHTAKRIFDRLRDEYDYPGGHTQVRDYVSRVKEHRQEAFVPLQFGPGEAQVDWGEAQIEHQGQRQTGHMFVLTLPFSDTRFVACFPRETLEFFLEGHLRAFEFLGGVPRRLVYDNLKSAVTKVGRGRRRDLNVTFEDFARHYLFDPDFCNVARGNEKGHVENGVNWARRNLFVPVPRFDDWGQFNEQLAERCRGQFLRVCRGHEQTMSQRLEEERGHFFPIPASTARPRMLKTWTVSKICLVRFDCNDYSAPCRYAYHPVTVRADVGKVRVFFQDRCVAEHTRCHEREKAIYEAWHYLPLIETKPRALDYGAPMKHLQLDDCFMVLRRRLEEGQEHSEGTRAYIRVLRLLEEYSLERLTQAVKRALELRVEHEEAIRHLALCPSEKRPLPLDLTGRGHLARFHFAPPKLEIYSTLGQGGAS